jgi:hypothetical protein
VSSLPAGYALVGATAFTAGATRTVSIAVIGLELTGTLEFLIPVFTGVFAACITGSRYSLSIYDSILKGRKLPYVRERSGNEEGAVRLRPKRARGGGSGREVFRGETALLPPFAGSLPLTPPLLDRFFGGRRGALLPPFRLVAAPYPPAARSLLRGETALLPPFRWGAAPYPPAARSLLRGETGGAAAALSLIAAPYLTPPLLDRPR